MKDDSASPRAREAALDEREDGLEVREAVLADRGDRERDLLVDADRRDMLADGRDMLANRRDMVANIDSHFAGEPGGGDSKVLHDRVDAAADRKDSQGDRAASKSDREQLTKTEAGDRLLPAARRGLITYQMSNMELAQVAAERLDEIGIFAATDGGTRVRIRLDADEDSQVRRLLEQIDPSATAVV